MPLKQFEKEISIRDEPWPGRVALRIKRGEGMKFTTIQRVC